MTDEGRIEQGAVPDPAPEPLSYPDSDGHFLTPIRSSLRDTRRSEA